MIILRNKEGKLLLAHKKGAPENDWYFPGGGVIECEKPLETFEREAYEELGIKKDNLKNQIISPIKHKYDWGIELENKTGYKGQDQTIVISDVKDETKIDLNISNELDKIKWLPIKDIFSTIPHKDMLKTLKKIIKKHNLTSEL
jgi:8-oxo-dGTP pyrophosphatase MutT (NUDIX family)